MAPSLQCVRVFFFNCKFENHSSGCLFVMEQTIIVKEPASPSSHLPSLHCSLPGSPLLTLFSILVTGKKLRTRSYHLWCFEQNQFLAPPKGRQNVQQVLLVLNVFSALLQGGGGNGEWDGQGRTRKALIVFHCISEFSVTLSWHGNHWVMVCIETNTFYVLW